MSLPFAHKHSSQTKPNITRRPIATSMPWAQQTRIYQISKRMSHLCQIAGNNRRLAITSLAWPRAAKVGQVARLDAQIYIALQALTAAGRPEKMEARCKQPYCSPPLANPTLPVLSSCACTDPSLFKLHLICRPDLKLEFPLLPDIPGTSRVPLTMNTHIYKHIHPMMLPIPWCAEALTKQCSPASSPEASHSPCTCQL